MTVLARTPTVKPSRVKLLVVHMFTPPMELTLCGIPLDADRDPETSLPTGCVDCMRVYALRKARLTGRKKRR